MPILLPWVRASEEAGSAAISKPAPSPEQLLRDYETTPQEFRDDRLLEVGVAYAEAGRLDRALPVYGQFLRDHPSHPKALRGLGNIYYLLRNYDQAVVYLGRARELGDPEALSVLGLSYLKAGRPNDMRSLIPELLDNRKDDPDVVNVLIGYVLDVSAKTHQAPDSDLLLKAVDALPDRDCLKRDDTTLLLVEAVRRLGYINKAHAARVAILRKIIRGYEAAFAAYYHLVIVKAKATYRPDAAETLAFE